MKLRLPDVCNDYDNRYQDVHIIDLPEGHVKAVIVLREACEPDRMKLGQFEKV
jgi:hypothetical protein